MGKILRYLGDCLSLLRRGRFFQLLRSLLTKLLPERWLGLRKGVFYRLARQEIPKPREAGAVRIFQGDADSVRRMVRDLHGDTASAHEFFAAFLDKGVQPWLAESDGRIIGVVWLFTASYTVPWEGYDAWLLRIEVEPTAKFVANVLVDPDQRGRGVFSLIAQRCFDAYPESEFYSSIDETNTASIISHEKLGFRRCGVVYQFRFFDSARCLFRPKRGKSRLLKLSRGVAVRVRLF